ncbi:mechanosensitive ion channel family protein [Coralloluteibacterium stylophorae]|uniref:Mechanosensitive ion channel n=1 Tax=Coralloluteibacterium stylophorae TaxID=1776034 RepID=A0AAP2FZ85_9GAMM|nr:mechanosensitive ion channel domain-containing protein [Coralloluteibacterium stylophorae]MBS7456555.1 mechanosensitive ion channel [Coralloluteibacterium stylophorae]
MPERWSSLDWSAIAANGWPLLAAVIMGLLVRRLLLAVERRARRGEHLRARIARVIAVPAAVALPLLFLSMAVEATPLPEAWVDRIQHLLGIGGGLCLIWLAVRVISAIEQRIRRRNPLESDDNLHARAVQTQARVLSRVAQGGVIIIGVAIVLMTFPSIRQIGATLLASAGIVGLVAGIAAKPVFGNLIAGLQIALTQPIRLDDVVIVEGEWGRIDEITSAYVVVRIWDERRLVVPLQWFIENPFQNWTRNSAQLLGTAFLWLDYRTPMGEVRDELQRICESDERWDGRVCVAQVTETDRHVIQVRLLVSARNSGDAFDLRCAVRERMIDFLNREHPQALPRMRADLVTFEDQRHPDEARRQAAAATPRAPTPDETSSPHAEDMDPAHAGQDAPGRVPADLHPGR